MSELPSPTTDVTDAELISAVRGGDLDAFGVLFGRHRDAAHRLARQLAPASDVDDLVADAFGKVMTALRNGNGPDEFFRAYLLTSLRSVHVDKIRASSRYKTTGDEAELDRAVEFVDPAEWKFEQSAAASAFASLPERWQMVLWHLDVERQKPADIAPMLGMSANSVSALAYRAREGLRVAYLQSHLAPTMDDACKKTTSLLGQYVRKSLRTRDMAAVDAHLDGCRQCTGLYLELIEINGGLAGWLAPIFLGAAAGGYLSGTGSLAGVTGLVVGTPARLTAAASSGSSTVAAISAATVTVVGGAVGVGVVANHAPSPINIVQPGPAAASVPATPSASTATARTRTTPRPSTPTPKRTRPTPPVPTLQAAPATTVSPSHEPTPTEASPSPDASPTHDPKPTPRPTPRPTTEPTRSTTPTPTPTPTPTRDTETIGSDYALGDITATNDGEFLQRFIDVPVSVEGDLMPDVDSLTVRITISPTGPHRPENLEVLGAGWSCGSITYRGKVGEFECTRTQSGARIPTLSFTYVGSYGTLSATVSAEGLTDPDTSDNSRDVAVRLWHLRS
jgi:RNA polymerase sigma factor (sigma-70 family)